VTPDIKRKLDAAAKSSGRSQSQEAELRIEQSFERANFIEQLYGRRLAGLLEFLGAVMKHAGINYAFESTKIAGRKRAVSIDDWISDPLAFDQVVKETIAALEGIRPLADIPEFTESTARTYAEGFLNLLADESAAGSEPGTGDLAAMVRGARERLGNAVIRTVAERRRLAEEAQ
jgi:hypothetical protein